MTFVLLCTEICDLLLQTLCRPYITTMCNILNCHCIQVGSTVHKATYPLSVDGPFSYAKTPGSRSLALASM
jgi:hypothetical protein